MQSRASAKQTRTGTIVSGVVRSRGSVLWVAWLSCGAVSAVAAAGRTRIAQASKNARRANRRCFMKYPFDLMMISQR